MQVVKAKSARPSAKSVVLYCPSMPIAMMRHSGRVAGDAQAAEGRVARLGAEEG